jgi:hypothetical protein
MLAACNALVAAETLKCVVAGANNARHGAYRHLLAQGSRIQLLGVAMQRDDEPGFNRPDCFVIDDWR